MKYNKELIETEALISARDGMLTNELGKFILQRSIEISGHAFVTNGDKELRQALVDDSVMRVCEKFLDYYVPEKCAANLIISMIYSTMTNKIVSLNWQDVYGNNIKGRVPVYKDGKRSIKLVKFVKDDYLSQKL